MTASTAASLAASVSELDTRAAALLSELQGLQHNPVHPETLSEWLRTYSRIKCELQTLWMECSLATARDSNDGQAQAIYQRLMETWIPTLETYDEPLARMALSAGAAEAHPGIALKLEADLGGQHTEELRELLAQERLLRSQYNTITSNQKVELSGTSLTAREALNRLSSTQEARERESIWQAIKGSNLSVARDLDALFTKLLRARQQVAVHAGKANYAEYVWQQTNREYSIQDAVELLDGIAEVFADLTARVDNDRAGRLGLERLRPWDLTVKLNSPTSNALRVDDYVATAEQVMERLDPGFGSIIRKLEVEGRFDLSPRLGKARGNFAAHLLVYGTSEVLCNLTGGLEEFRTLLHELGHAVHWNFISADPESTFWDFYNFHEVCEFYAFAFTILGTYRVLEDFELSQEDQRRYKRSLAESFLSRLRDVDERVRIELWLYQQTQDVSTEEVDAHYVELYHRPAVDWSGHEDILRKGWQNQFLFLHSFYNIEYSIATVAVLLFMKLYEEDPQGAMLRMKKAIRMGATAGSTAIFTEVGVQFPFSKEQLVTARDVLAEWLI